MEGQTQLAARLTNQQPDRADEANLQRDRLEFKVLRAVNIPKDCLFGTPNCYASVSVDSGDPRVTSTVKNANPKWDETFSFDVKESSKLTIQIIHVTRKQLKKVKATITLSVAEYRLVKFRNNEFTFDLRSPTSMSILKGAKLVLSSCTNVSTAQATRPASDLVADATSLQHFVEAQAEHFQLNVLDDTIEEAPAHDYLGQVMGYLGRFVDIGNQVAELHPFAKVAWKVLTAGYQVLKEQQDRDENVRKLWETVLDTVEFMKSAEEVVNSIKGVEKTAQAIMKQIYECTLFLRTYGEHGFLVRTGLQAVTMKTDEDIAKFNEAFTELGKRFRNRVDLDRWKIARSIKDGVLQIVANTDIVRLMAEDTRLDKLPGADLANVQWDPDRTCLPKTRENLLDEIIDWAHDMKSESPRILWLSGAAGTGKSSVANSAAQILHEFRRLGASFRFDRDVTRPETPGQLFGNLCYQLAHFDDHLRTAILAAIHHGGGAAMSLTMQARTLLVEPTKEAVSVGPIVIVIDALDESAVFGSKTKPSHDDLVRALVQELPSFPPSIKVLITSRDEGVISRLLPHCSLSLRKRIDDVANTRDDILRYIQHRMVQIRRYVRDPEWPGATQEDNLADRADSLFVWANVACMLIEAGPDPAVQLRNLLDISFEGVAVKHLDDLFAYVLDHSAFPASEERSYVLGSIVAFKMPLTLSGIDDLLGLSNDLAEVAATLVDGHKIQLTRSRYVISSIKPILRGDPEANGVVRLLHKSVFDFLTSRAAPSLRVDLGVQNGILAKQCLIYMNKKLRHDICKIGDCSLLHSEVDDLPDRIRDNISEGLRYACCYFAVHLIDSSIPQSAFKDELVKFITEHLLHWMEVMSLVDQLYNAGPCLKTLLDYLKIDSTHIDLSEIIESAISLLRNCANAISISALHIYASAIPLIPKTLALFKKYSHQSENTAMICSTHPLWTTSLWTLEGHTNLVISVVFSPDGTKLASASDDNTVRLWDVESGLSHGPVLEGHTDRVTSVVFSPDGTKLASASFDNIVCLWDVESGLSHGPVLEGHTYQVTSVVFSPDGTKLASASDDNTVHLWDVETCSSISDPNVNKWYKDLSYPITIDKNGFLIYKEKQLLWLPAHLRGSTTTVMSNTIAIGGSNGAVTLVKIP